MNQQETTVFQMYRDIELGANDTCRSCVNAERVAGRKLGRPVSFWHIGDQFDADPYRVVFVGKNAVDGTELPLFDNRCHDASWRGAELYRSRCSDFWTYTEEIIGRLFGVGREQALRRIAVTNLVKCNHSTGEVRKDTTSESMKRHCISELGVVRRELEILKPRAIVFYTHDSCDGHISNLRFGESFKDVTGTHHMVPVGEKTILWWHRTFFAQGRPILHFLRTSHPERKKKEDFVQAIVSWLSQNRVA